MLLRYLGLKVILSLLLIEAACTAYQFDQQQKVLITLTPNSEFQIQMPQASDQHSNKNISSFRNLKTQAISSPCLLQKEQMSVFRKEGEIQHNWLLVSEGSMFWRGNIWDIIEVKNTIVVVFQDGEVTYFKTKNQTKDKDAGYFQKKQMVTLLDENIAYGRLFEYKDDLATHIIYMSQNGCYLVQTESWIKLSGYDGDRFSDAIIIGDKIITANRGKLKIYALRITDFKIELETQASVFSMQSEQKIIITISSLYHDAKNDRIYLIDDYQGVKYINMPNSTNTMQIEAQNLLYSQKCQDIVMAQQLLFFSCSSLVVVNATSLNLLQEIQYPFHVNRIYYTDGELIALGDHQLVIYLVIKNSNKQIKVDFLFRGNLTGKVYQHYHYLHSSKYILLFSQYGLEYGKIVAPKSTIKCAYRYIAGPQQYQQMIGINTGQLSIYSRCKYSQNSSYYSQCLSKYDIQIKIHDIKGIKFVFWLVLGMLIGALAITSSIRMVKLLKEKKRVEQIKQQQEYSVEEGNKVEDKTTETIKVSKQ